MGYYFVVVSEAGLSQMSRFAQKARCLLAICVIEQGGCSKIGQAIGIVKALLPLLWETHRPT
jgi:hypothetical protein